MKQCKIHVDFATLALFCNFKQAKVVIKIYNPTNDSLYCLEAKLMDAYLQDTINSALEKVFKNDLDLINVSTVGDVNLH